VFFKAFFFGVLFISGSSSANQDPGGWLWYKDPPKIEEPSKPKIEMPPSSQSQPEKTSKPLTALDRLAILQNHFEEVKARAVLNPTLENVVETRRLHNAIIALASGFEESWMVAELLDRETALLNTSPGALTVQRDQEDKNLDQSLKALSKNHGLLFLFDKDCPYCKDFAPLAIQFAHTYGFELSGLSATAGSLTGMTCRHNTAAFERLNPSGSVPLLILVNPSTGDVIPLAQGYINWQDLRRNARWAIQYLRGSHP
jgi:conjugal transfer pilus assembly protein TraF